MKVSFYDLVSSYNFIVIAFMLNLLTMLLCERGLSSLELEL